MFKNLYEVSNMNALTLEKHKNFVPWYERLSEFSFQQFVVTELERNLQITKTEAMKKYKEMSEFSIFDERCKSQENTYSIRYRIMNELEKTA